VDVVERLANADGTLVLLGSKLPEQIACAPQCKSRLSAGLHVAIGSPQDADLDTLLDLITKQRGLQLKESKRSYLLRRVTRTLPALVECVDKLDEGTELGSSSTSFQALSGALGSLS
jgi:chromosomal replication initiation ATPase DnaA